MQTSGERNREVVKEAGMFGVLTSDAALASLPGDSGLPDNLVAAIGTAVNWADALTKGFAGPRHRLLAAALGLGRDL